MLIKVVQAGDGERRVYAEQKQRIKNDGWKILQLKKNRKGEGAKISPRRVGIVGEGDSLHT